MTSLKIGLVGAGVFGGYHAGKIAGAGHTIFTGVFDADPARATMLAEKHGVTAHESDAALFEASDAVIIACPATWHAETVRKALQAGCHVLVEKPLALTGAEAQALAALAGEKELILQVGHQERLVMTAMGLFDIPERPTAIEAVREGPPAPGGRAGDTSVIFDLMIHDLDLVAKLLGKADDVHGSGEIIHSGHVDVARADLSFEGGATAIVHASRAAETRRRSMSVTYPSGEIFIDFLTREITNSTGHPIRADISESLPDPLGAADSAFFESCLTGAPVLVPGHEAAEAVRVAELIEKSITEKTGA